MEAESPHSADAKQCRYCPPRARSRPRPRVQQSWAFWEWRSGFASLRRDIMAHKEAAGTCSEAAASRANVTAAVRKVTPSAANRPENKTKPQRSTNTYRLVHHSGPTEETRNVPGTPPKSYDFYWAEKGHAHLPEFILNFFPRKAFRWCKQESCWGSEPLQNSISALHYMVPPSVKHLAKINTVPQSASCISQNNHLTDKHNCGLQWSAMLPQRVLSHQ